MTERVAAVSHSNITTLPPAYSDFSEVLNATSLPEWIDRNFLRHDPYAFSSAGKNYFADFVAQCSKNYDVDPNGIYCIGSGATGLSFNPYKYTAEGPKKFSRSSDLDIAIISPYYFETAWRDLRLAAHPAYSSPSQRLMRKIDHQRGRMFDGAIVANKLMAHLSFGGPWSLALRRMEYEWQDTLNITGGLNFWIYRDYWSVRSYVAEGIEKCREKARISQ